MLYIDCDNMRVFGTCKAGDVVKKGLIEASKECV